MTKLSSVCYDLLQFKCSPVDGSRSSSFMKSIFSPVSQVMWDQFLTFFGDKMRDIVKFLLSSHSAQPSWVSLSCEPAQTFWFAIWHSSPVLFQAHKMLLGRLSLRWTVSDEMKHVIVRPLLKKPSLDLRVLSHWRPGSNLSFMWEISEKIECHLQRFLLNNNIFKVFQSGFTKKVENDILWLSTRLNLWY